MTTSLGFRTSSPLASGQPRYQDERLVVAGREWSLGVKPVLAAGAPLGLVSVVRAVVIGDMGMSLAVTGNAMRLANVRPDDKT